MKEETTLKLLTNLDRPAVERLLAEVRTLAAEQGMTDLADMFADVGGASRADLERKVNAAIQQLRGNDAAKLMSANLEMALLNLPNLK
ncbi:MAG TPA: hypothetical protein VLW45_04510 [Pelomicrobium sp.]|nr:hypothetical protein [Pelomicrobium sp.]